MNEFDDIRPYRDDEVRPIIERMLADPELTDAVTRLKFPALHGWLGWLLKPLVRRKLAQQLAGITDVKGFQRVVAKYMEGMVNTRVKSLTVSGLEKLDKHTAYLFISNHRDIAMDPAFVNWVLYHNDCNTLRIAI